MFATTLLTLLPFLLLTIANATHRHQFLSDDLSSECQFVLGGRRYDLCPIINGPSRILHKIGVSDLDSSIKMTYKLTLAGYHHAEKDTPSSTPSTQIRNCPEGTWICGTTISYHPKQPPGVIQVFPVAGKYSRTPSIEGSLNAAAVLHSTPGALTLHLKGGFLEDRPQTARIEFVCDPNADEPSSPTFSGKSNGVHSFIWSTKHGCSHPITSSKPHLSIFEDDPPSDETVPEEETPKDEQELAPPMSPPSNPHRFTTILLLTGSVLIALYVLFYSPPVRQFVQSCVKRIHIPTQFRVGEVKLVRWAQEDMEILADEEDFMVNANADGDEDLGLMDEYIPLKPSPRKNFMPNYGSARPW